MQKKNTKKKYIPIVMEEEKIMEMLTWKGADSLK